MKESIFYNYFVLFNKRVKGAPLKNYRLKPDAALIGRNV